MKLRMKTALSVFASTLISISNAQPGSLDISFNSTGTSVLAVGPSSDIAYDIAEQTDGKIVVAGKSFNGSDFDFAIARYETNGSLDASFGNSGLVTLDIGGDTDEAYGVKVQTDGKIVIAGLVNNGSDYDFCVVRLKSNGDPDSTFDSDGIVITPVGSSFDFVTDMALQSDGKILVTGYAYAGSDFDFAIVRYEIDGSLDNSFGTGGIVVTDMGTGDNLSHCIAVKNNGKIVIAGTEGFKFAMAQYDDDGNLDTGFGSGGFVTTTMGTTSMANDIAIQGNSKIVLVGSVSNSLGSTDFAVARYNSSGGLDITFSGDGKATTSFFSGDDRAYGVDIQYDGKIIAAGVAFNGSNNDFAIARYNTDGTPDLTFNSTGRVVTALGTSGDEIRAVTLDQNAKLLVAGSSDVASTDFAVGRYITGASNSIRELSNKTVKVYPNPVLDHQLYLDLPSDQPARIQIYDATGSEVMHVNLDDGELLNLDKNLVSGLYFIKVLQENTYSNATFFLIK